MKLKECLAVNESDKVNIKIFNLDTDEMMILNEEASLIFVNRDRDDDYIKKLFMERYHISNEEELLEDIENTKAYFEENFYE